MAQRDEKGYWKRGCSGNPSGKNGHIKGLQRYGARASYWLQKLTVKELIAIYSDKKGFEKLSSWDAIIIRHLSSTIMGKEITAERKELLARIEGKPKAIKNFRQNKPQYADALISFLLLPNNLQATPH